MIYETNVISGLSFPDWISGTWQNSGESNTNRYITYSFSNNTLNIRHGLYFKSHEKFIEPYKNYKITETQTDSSYLITLKKGTNSITYEFKLESVDWSDSKVLTYSIVENEKLKRMHFKSVNLVLHKI